jgi:predicted dehydrogenase
MAKQRIGWGIIGSGGIARRRTIPEGFAPASNAELVAVYDVDATVNECVARDAGARAAGSIGELLAMDLDAVYIATPVWLHCPQALQCFAAGKHVFCEKPLGITVAEAERMTAAAAEAGCRLGCAFMMRFHAQHQAALRMIQDGRIGKPVYARAQLSCWYPPLQAAWRQDSEKGGGGSLIDMGGHCIDLLEMFFGKVKKVSCFVGNSVQDYEPEDSAVAMLAFENGAFATVDAFFCVPDRSSDNVLELYGSLGSILAKGTIGQAGTGTMVARLEGQAGGYEARQGRVSTGGIEITPDPVNPYLAEIEAFSQALLDGCEPPVGAQAGLRSQRVLAACYTSARTGAVIEIV